MRKEINVRLNANRAKAIHTGHKFASGDKGIVFRIAVDELDTTGTTAKIVFKRSNGTSVEAGISETEGIYSYTTLGNEFAVVGPVVADVKFYEGENRVSTCTFVFEVTSDTLDGIAAGAAGYSDTLEQMKAGMEETEQEMNALTDELQELYEDYTAAFGNVAPFNPRGMYSETESYAVRDLVTYDNATWVCYKNCTGATPGEDSDCWQKIHGNASVEVDTVLSTESTNPIANKAVAEEFGNYLKKSGGTVNGDVEVKKTESVLTMFTIANALRRLGFRVGADGGASFYDYTNEKTVFTMFKEGTNAFNGTATENLPLNGGTLKAPDFVILTLESTLAAERPCIKFVGPNGNLGYLGFEGINNPSFFNSNGRSYSLLHTGNKPTGTYTGNGDASERVIETGGIGTMLYLRATGFSAIVLESGAIVLKSDGTIQYIPYQQTTFKNGKLTLKTDGGLNTNGTVFTYTVH